MQYQFECKNHGSFEVSQPILAEHKAYCPVCGELAQRLFASLDWRWAGSVFRENGSYREDKDYAPVMRG